MEEVQDDGEEPLPVWPPRIEDPPQLPYSSGEPLSLLVDPEALPPEPPEFMPGRLAAKAGESVVPDAVPSAVNYDRRNPTGRTRGDRVLRPTDQDRIDRLTRKRRNAAFMAASVVGGLVFLPMAPSLLQWLGLVVVGAAAGWAAYDLGDSEVSWALSLGFVGIPAAWSHDVGGMLIAFLFFAAAGWFVGFVRDANLD